MIASARAALVSILLALGGCSTIDRDQARLCRIALPALEAPGTGIAVLRHAAIELGVKVTYRATPPGKEALERFAACRFAFGRRLDIEAITTDRGEIPGATVYLLRRYYVATPEGVAADPGPPAPDAGVSGWPPDLALFIALVIAAMLRASGLLLRSGPR